MCWHKSRPFAVRFLQWNFDRSAGSEWYVPTCNIPSQDVATQKYLPVTMVPIVSSLGGGGSTWTWPARSLFWRVANDSAGFYLISLHLFAGFVVAQDYNNCWWQRASSDVESFGPYCDGKFFFFWYFWVTLNQEAETRNERECQYISSICQISQDRLVLTSVGLLILLWCRSLGLGICAVFATRGA